MKSAGTFPPLLFEGRGVFSIESWVLCDLPRQPDENDLVWLMRLPTVVYRYLLLFRSLSETQDGAGFSGVHLSGPSATSSATAEKGSAETIFRVGAETVPADGQLGVLLAAGRPEASSPSFPTCQLKRKAHQRTLPVRTVPQA